ncbi:hypothetical protein M011DRAFT_117788 [Sporormia fimetaria CBS 119925]|uniref:Uncharacterized protein n=1 Tax=Sporormia fimetaria CBS 119925 TaxID=1340428 RepID=A0A6A6VP52_9PLEO|nr:hypothetical protein M011DRAFT_117788 [Sporormia fimetaria CBS 119925]
MVGTAINLLSLAILAVAGRMGPKERSHGQLCRWREQMEAGDIWGELPTANVEAGLARPGCQDLEVLHCLYTALKRNIDLQPMRT